MMYTVSENGVSRKPASKLSALCQYRSARPLLDGALNYVRCYNFDNYLKFFVKLCLKFS